MEAEGSFWSARERTVIANMENHLDKSDDMKLEVGELEVDLMWILTHARRRSSRIFAIFNTKEKSDHSVAGRNRWLEPRTEGRSASQSDLCWTEACEGIAKRLLEYMEDSEITKVNTREVEEQVCLETNQGSMSCGSQG